MSDFVLDTHACIYALAAPARLGKAARRALKAVEAGRGVAWIPAAVVAELILLRESGRSRIGVREIEAAIEQAPSLRFLPLDFRQLDEFAAQVSIVDPFDRLIVSSCRATGATLITKDQALTDSAQVRVVWN